MNVKTTAVITKAEQSEATRAALLSAARELFASQGYAGTATEEIVQRAGVTRGALYYQFRDKEDVFRAVYQEIERELTDAILAQMRARLGARMGGRIAPGASAWEEVREGSQAYLDACLDPQVQRIALLEAPAVLGRGASRDLVRFGLDLIRRGLQRSIEQGLIAPQPVEPLAHLLRAALTEAALLIARADDHAAARAEVGAAVDRVIDGLRAPE